jgi:LEA14-like dessication related protein
MSGCAMLKKWLGGFAKPTLHFKTANLASANFSQATVNLIYTLKNPNPLGLSLASVDYAFFVEGKQVVAGAPPDGLKIGANKSTDLTFPANVKFADIVPVVQTFLTKDMAAYRVEGSLGVDTPIGVVKLPLSREGQFEVPKVPAIEMGSPRVTNLSLTGATLELPLKVTNRNSYDLPITGVTGSLAIAGANVGSVNTGDLGALAAKAVREMVLPLRINFAQSGVAAASALRGGAANVALKAQVHSGGMAIPFNVSQQLSFRK